KTQNEGEHIILLGTHDKAKEKVFKYFVPLEDTLRRSSGFIQNTQLYFGMFKYTVTSIDGEIEDEKRRELEALDRTTLLICHPSAPKPFTAEWKAHFEYLKEKSKCSHIVLTECNCPCERLCKCNIPYDVQQDCTGKPILFGNHGKEFGYRLFLIKCPTAETLLELTPQIPITGRLVAEHLPDIVRYSVKCVRQVGQFILFFINVKRHGSSLMIKHCYI
ncbi:Hypothetical predicted protein, partial [Mytilus galloprovincialis]